MELLKQHRRLLITVADTFFVAFCVFVLPQNTEANRAVARIKMGMRTADVELVIGGKLVGASEFRVGRHVKAVDTWQFDDKSKLNVCFANGVVDRAVVTEPIWISDIRMWLITQLYSLK